MLQILELEFMSVAEVAERLEQIEKYCRRRRDPRGIFATAYLQITRAIEAEIVRNRFRDNEWVARYLVRFGNLYRQALLAYERKDYGLVPRAWRIAFDTACAGRGLVIQHLLLGINAHINYDLALTLEAVGIDPDRQDKYADHTHVNDILEAATDQLKSSVSGMYAPVLERLDWIGGRIDDELARFSIERARDHAWSFAVALQAAKGDTERGLLLRALDSQAAVMANVILAPPTRHPWVMKAAQAASTLDAKARKLMSRLRNVTT